jgi:predicted negative regulator of RcsB-dependent stress response
MDEESALISANTRNEKIKNFFINNKKMLIISCLAFLLIVFGYFIFNEINKKKKIKIANEYNLATINFISGNKENVKKDLIKIINKKDKTYSLLSLYFLIDNKIVEDNKEINNLFDTAINKINLETEIKNLLIYKKAIFNSEFASENDLLKIIKPIINNNSIWKSDALFLMGEYFYHKKQKKKAKEFYNQIITLEDSNINIKKAAQKRLNRDLSD